MSKYGYGIEADATIKADAQILIKLYNEGTIKEEQIRKTSMKLWDLFVANGGDGNHSGFSFCCVRHEALEQLGLQNV